MLNILKTIRSIFMPLDRLIWRIESRQAMQRRHKQNMKLWSEYHSSPARR